MRAEIRYALVPGTRGANGYVPCIQSAPCWRAASPRAGRAAAGTPIHPNAEPTGAKAGGLRGANSWPRSHRQPQGRAAGPKWRGVGTAPPRPARMASRRVASSRVTSRCAVPTLGCDSAGPSGRGETGSETFAAQIEIQQTSRKMRNTVRIYTEHSKAAVFIISCYNGRGMTANKSTH